MNNKACPRGLVSIGFCLILITGFVLPGYVHGESVESIGSQFVYKSKGKPDPFISFFSRGGEEAKTVASKEKILNERLQKIKVNGVLWQPTDPLVMINSEIYKIGDSVEGLTVHKIEENSVTFEYMKLTYEIVIIEEINFEN